MVPFWSQRLFQSDSNNGPSPGHSNLVSDEVVGSVNNKTKRLRMEHVKGRKFTEKNEKEE